MITPSQFNLFISTVNTMIGEVYAETDQDIGVQWMNFATEMPSGSTQSVYGWTEMLQKAREWVGPRVVMEAAPLTYTVVNRPWEHTLGVDRFLLDDDHLGILYRQIPDQVRQVRRQPDYWIRDLIEGLGVFATGQPGSPQLGFDGLSNFNTAHSIDPYNPTSTTYSNDFTGGGASIAGGVPGGSGSTILVGGAFGVTAFATLYEYQLRMLGEDLEPLGIIPDTLMVPVTLKTEAELILHSTFFAPPAWATIGSQVGAADNPFRRFAVDKVLVNPYLTSGTKWYLMDTKRTIKPMMWQVREAAVYTQRVNEQDPVVFDTHRYLYGAWGRGAPAWGYAFLMARSGP